MKIIVSLSVYLRPVQVIHLRVDASSGASLTGTGETHSDTCESEHVNMLDELYMEILKNIINSALRTFTPEKPVDEQR